MFDLLVTRLSKAMSHSILRWPAARAQGAVTHAHAMPADFTDRDEASGGSEAKNDSCVRDLWTIRARPTFLYVMYAVILWAFPVGLIGAFNPRVATAMTVAMAAYLTALPEPVYTLFATGYLGYATLRQWGKVKGSDR